MGSIFRSEPMTQVQLFIQMEAARDTIDELGKLGLIQFGDLNHDVNAFQRNFVAEVKRCDEAERKIRFFQDQLAREKEEIANDANRSREDRALLLFDASKMQPPVLGRLDALEARFDDLEKELLQMNASQETLNKNYNELVELKHVLEKDAEFFSEGGGGGAGADFGATPGGADSSRQPLLSDKSEARSIKLGFVTGVIARDKLASFERLLWRATRGNLFMKNVEIESTIRDPSTGEMVHKNVFIIFYQGERAQVKVKKICDSYNANTYPCPESQADRRNTLQAVKGRLVDLEAVLSRTKKHRRQVIFDVARSVTFWAERITKEKAIYHTMNLFNYDVTRHCLVGEGWCPSNATERIVRAMRVASETAGSATPSVLMVNPVPTEEPPTFFKTNRFTASFQTIVDAYGIAHYREVNPAVFSIITFPFLFGVMFGDFGHGLIMTAFAALMIAKEKQLSKARLNEMVRTCFQGRYMLLLMGIFSTYAGLMYNEAFAIPMDIFGGTRWQYTCRLPDNTTHLTTGYPDQCYWCIGGGTDCPTANRTTLPQESYLKNSDDIYPIGADPEWKAATNTLLFYNSLKMKMSVIMGVTQMCVGIVLSLLNALHFRKKINIFGEFIPQMIFMLSLFGYMCLLIIIKWLSPGPEHKPLLLTLMINMFLSPTSLTDADALFSGQKEVQYVLILLMFVSVPWMLLTKPYFLRKWHNESLVVQDALGGDDDNEHDEANAGGVHSSGGGGGGGHGGEHEEEFDFSEIFIHQIIHTIEFVLGAISNTASYLRLWALSLAHAELSEVFWEQVFVRTLAMTGGGAFIFVFIGFAVWAAATFGVLLVMESLSAFLHALRLHWVEFMNKFYMGDGKPFKPFAYETLLAGEDDA